MVFFLTLGGPLGSGTPGLCLPCLPYCYAPAQSQYNNTVNSATGEWQVG